jgi:hypothetical protein
MLTTPVTDFFDPRSSAVETRRPEQNKTVLNRRNGIFLTVMPPSEMNVA